MSEPDTRGRSQIQAIVEQLRTPISDLSTLLILLTGPLDAIGILPPQFRVSSTCPLPRILLDDGGHNGGLNIRKHMPQLQRVLLSHVLPAWGQIPEEENGNLLVLVDQYFCPDGFVNTQQAAGDVALVAYATLMSPATTLTGTGGYGIKILTRLITEYPVDRLHRATFHGGDGVLRGVEWEDCVKDVCKVPTVVANAVAGRGSLPDVLENGTYFNRLSMRCEGLIYSFSESGKHQAQFLESIIYLLTKLVNLGVFPPHPPVARSQPSFLRTTIPSIRLHLLHSEKYAQYWASLFQYLGSISSLTVQSILGSLFGNIHISDSPSLAQDASNSTRARVKREAKLLTGLVGPLDAYLSDATSLWQILTDLIVSRDWSELHARTFVAWLSGASSEINTKVLDAFLQTVLDSWSSPEHIKHSAMSRHRYMTSLLLLTISYFPPSSPSIQSIVSSPEFVGAISVYISHLDPSVRRCGMLAAEVVAHLCQRKLDFGPWEGEGEGKPWCRALRVMLRERDVNAVEEEKNQLEMDVEPAEGCPDAEKSISSNERPAPRATFIQTHDGGHDSDDSLTGYASTPSSSRSTSPSPSELAEIEKDPTLNVGPKKVARPVYLAQLGELLRGTGTQTQSGPNDAHEADRIQMALNCAEELIRRKEGFGTELDENAVNLVYALLSLQDNFDLEGFSEKRQGAMNALVACAPRKASPALIQEFFKNQYSADQRFVALNALAIGARELASLPVPSSALNLERTVFPSKMLPSPLHHKYVSQSKDRGKTDRDVIPLMVEQLAKHALEGDSKEASATTSPALIRERRLRLQKSQRVTEIASSSSSTLNPYTHQPHQTQLPISSTKFIDIAAEHFILPLISSFWAFLRDEQTREANTAHRTGRARYRGAGTGLILNALVLAQMVRTLAIMVHASRNAREWMAVVAPEALELAVMLGTRPVSRIDNDDDDGGENEERQQNDSAFNTNKEASLLTSTLELALVVLDGALELDGGRILGLENTALVLGLGEWAGRVFAGLEKGLKVQGGGGVHEAKLSRATAGVLIKVDELSSRWSRSMIDTR